MGRGVEIVVSRQDSEMVKIISGAAVVPVSVLEFPEIVQDRNLLKSELKQTVKETERKIEIGITL